MLGVPVVKATARSGRGINHLLEAVHNVITGNEKPKPKGITYISPIEQAAGVLERAGVERYKALRMLEDGKEPDDLKLKAAYMKAQGILERFNVSGDHFIESRTLSVFQKSDLISKTVSEALPSKLEKEKKFLIRFLWASIRLFRVCFLFLQWFCGLRLRAPIIRLIFCAVFSTILRYGLQML